jgi:hypothetical protein
MAARFEVHHGVNLKDRYLFGLIGVIEEGMVHTGMEASLEEADRPAEILGKVHGVEFIEQDGITEPTLTFHYRNPEKIRRWESIDWKGKKLRLEWSGN